MNQPSAIDTLVEALTAVPAYKNPLNPFYEALAGERLPRPTPSRSLPLVKTGGQVLHGDKPLTLRIIRQHTQLLHEQVDQAQDQTIAINRVIASCKQIPPTPFSALPLRF